MKRPARIATILAMWTLGGTVALDAQVKKTAPVVRASRTSSPTYPLIA